MNEAEIAKIMREVSETTAQAVVETVEYLDNLMKVMWASIDPYAHESFYRHGILMDKRICLVCRYDNMYSEFPFHADDCAVYALEQRMIEQS